LVHSATAVPERRVLLSIELMRAGEKTSVIQPMRWCHYHHHRCDKSHLGFVLKIKTKKL
jgi:hypothetical protein